MNATIRLVISASNLPPASGRNAESPGAASLRSSPPSSPESGHHDEARRGGRAEPRRRRAAERLHLGRPPPRRHKPLGGSAGRRPQPSRARIPRDEPRPPPEGAGHHPNSPLTFATAPEIAAIEWLVATAGLLAIATLLVKSRIDAREPRDYALFEVHLSMHDDGKPGDLKDMVEALTAAVLSGRSTEPSGSTLLRDRTALRPQPARHGVRDRVALRARPRGHPCSLSSQTPTRTCVTGSSTGSIPNRYADAFASRDTCFASARSARSSIRLRCERRTSARARRWRRSPRPRRWRVVDRARRVLVVAPICPGCRDTLRAGTAFRSTSGSWVGLPHSFPSTAETDTVKSVGVDAEYRFASGVVASKPGSMVYLDLVQAGPHIDRAKASPRIVMRPELLAEFGSRKRPRSE